MNFCPDCKQTNSELLLSGQYAMTAELFLKICTFRKLSSTCLILHQVCTELIHIAILLPAKYFDYGF